MVVEKIMCLVCGKILKSDKHHSLKYCGCDNETMIDCGDKYFRYGAKNLGLVLRYNYKKKRWEQLNEMSRKETSRRGRLISLRREMNY